MDQATLLFQMSLASDMNDNYKKCLKLLKDMSGRELIELQYSISQHIYAKGVEEHIRAIQMQPFITELVNKNNK